MGCVGNDGRISQYTIRRPSHVSGIELQFVCRNPTVCYIVFPGMPPHFKFLIVDDNPDSRFLLVKTLLRKFPQAVLKETQDGESSVALARSEPLDAIVVHRAA